MQNSAHFDKAAVLSWQYTHHTGTTNTHDTMCGRGPVPDSRLHAKAPANVSEGVVVYIGVAAVFTASTCRE